MTNVESMGYTHFYLSIVASLFGTVHCPFSPRELVQTSPVHPNPVIRYALSHISLLISSSKQPPYLPIMAFPQPFRDILSCNFHHHHIYDLSIYCHIALHDRKIASMMFSWLVRFLMSILHTCHSCIIAHPGTPPEASIQSHTLFQNRVVIIEIK